MVQILMAEDTPLRLLLVDMMSEIEGKMATIRLRNGRFTICRRMFDKRRLMRCGNDRGPIHARSS